MIFDGNRVTLGRYISALADAVGLRDWSISLQDDPCADDVNGTCQCVYGRRVASIALSRNWMNADEYDLRETIVHELLHCHTDPITYPLAGIEDHLGSSLHTHLVSSQALALELAVDAIASAFAPRLPLPSEWRSGAFAAKGGS